MANMKTLLLIFISSAFLFGCAGDSSDSDLAAPNTIYAKSDISAFSFCDANTPCADANRTCVDPGSGNPICIEEALIDEVFACTVGQLQILESYPVQLRCSSAQ